MPVVCFVIRGVIRNLLSESINYKITTVAIQDSVTNYLADPNCIHINILHVPVLLSEIETQISGCQKSHYLHVQKPVV